MKRQSWLSIGCILTLTACPLFASDLGNAPLLAGGGFNPMGMMDDMFDSDDRRHRHRRPPPPYYAPGYRYPGPPVHSAPRPVPYQGAVPYGQAARGTPQSAAPAAAYAPPPPPGAAPAAAAPQRIYRPADGHRTQPPSPASASAYPISPPSSIGSSPSTSDHPVAPHHSPEPAQEAASSSQTAGQQYMINGKPAVFRPLDLGTE